MTSPNRTALPAAAAALLTLAGVASAQPPAGTPRPPAVSQPTLQTQATVAPAAPVIVNPAPVVNPYALGAYTPYGYSGYVPYRTPVEGYLSGVADVTNANGVYLSQVQQARLLQSQADSSRLDLRRKIIEQRQYEAALQPTSEQLRQKQILYDIDRARGNPPLREIWSGKALNDLLLAIQRAQTQGVVGPSVPVDPEVLAHVNVTAGTTYGGTGMLKDLTRLRWPRSLLEEPFAKGKARVEEAVRKAVGQAPAGPVDDATARELDGAIAAMQADLKDAAPDMTPTDYIQGARFLRELKESSALMQDPSVPNYFNSKWKPTGATVAELVGNLTAKGLHFSAAMAGDESYYTALHSSMAAYDYAVNRVAAR